MAKMVVMVDMEAVDTARAGVPVAVHMAAMVAVAAVVEAVAVLMAADAAVVMVQLAVTVRAAIGNRSKFWVSLEIQTFKFTCFYIFEFIIINE